MLVDQVEGSGECLCLLAVYHRLSSALPRLLFLFLHDLTADGPVWALAPES